MTGSCDHEVKNRDPTSGGGPPHPRNAILILLSGGRTREKPRPRQDRRVASASAMEKVPSHGSLIRLNVVSVGTIVWLSSELMFFAALFAMYFTVRSINARNWPPHDVVLDLKTAAPFTIILVLSSVT